MNSSKDPMIGYVYDIIYDNNTIKLFCTDTNEDSEHKDSKVNTTSCLTVDDFHPYFYIALPSYKRWNDEHVDLIMDYIDEKYFQPNELVSYEHCRKKKLYYAHKDPTTLEDKFYDYILCTCRTNVNFYRYGKILKKINIPRIGYLQLSILEYNVSPILQFCCSLDITTSGWIQYTPHYEEKEPKTRCDKEYTISCSSIRKHTTTKTSTVKIMSFDIETYSDTDLFPSALNIKDCVYMVSCVLWWIGQSHQTKKILVVIGEVDQDVVGHDVEIIIVKDEVELLLQFIELLKQHNPHIITGWNIFNFDISYIVDRCRLYSMEKNLRECGMFKDKECKLVDKNWSSSAYGEQNFKYVEYDGRITMDLMTFVKRNNKLKSYKLDYVANHYLKTGKDPITKYDIFNAYRYGEKSLLSLVGKYCVKDSFIVFQLFDYFDTWIDLAETANVCNLEISKVMTRGQQIKVYSQLYKYCYDNHIVVEDNPDQLKGESYEGAFVLEPTPGIYHAVTSFDFKSLYPSIAQAYNLDYTTFVIDDDIPDDKCHVFDFEEDGKKYHYRFLKEPRGVIPSIIDHFLDARKKTVREMEQLKKKSNLTSDEKNYTNVLNKRQQNHKVMCNSVYGILAAPNCHISLLPAARIITHIGRVSVHLAGELLQNKYGATLIYQDTDSCYVLFPSVPIEQLFEYSEQVEKEIYESNVFKKPMYLAFERKIYEVMLLIQKKRYMYVVYGDPSRTIESKGSILVRRDSFDFFSTVYTDIINLIFDKQSLSTIKDYIINICNSCLQRQVPIEQFLLSKTVNPDDTYKVRPLPTDEKKLEQRLKKLNCTTDEYFLTKCYPAHVQLAHRIRGRGGYVQDGDRLEYVITTRGGLKGSLSDKIEEPAYIQENNLFYLDYIYYIKLLKNQLNAVLAAAGMDTFMTEYYNLIVNKQKCMDTVRELFKPVFHFIDT